MARVVYQGFVLLLIAFPTFAQQHPKSHEECIKVVPGDWGPNFGEEWHHNEALYWGCRLAVSSETVDRWQKAAEEHGMAQEIKLFTVRGERLVVFEEMEGTAHCYDVRALRRMGSDWKAVWELPGEESEYCTYTCPALGIKVVGDLLTVASPNASDAKCKRRSWSYKQFRWNGDTFVPATAAATSSQQ